MIKIMWNGYIRDQLQWAEKLAAIALDTNLAVDHKMLKLADMALSNAQGATNAQMLVTGIMLPEVRALLSCYV
jgi:hypothetical protein